MNIKRAPQLASLFAALLLVGPADAQDLVLKFSHFLGPTSFFQVDVVEPWARELEAKTGGRVKVETYDGTSPLGKVGEQATNAKDGKVDIALGLRGAEGDKFPGSSRMVPSRMSTRTTKSWRFSCTIQVSSTPRRSRSRDPLT